MRYLGIDNTGGISAIGVYDSQTHAFNHKNADFGGRAIGYFYFANHKNRQNWITFVIVLFLAILILRRLLFSIKTEDINYIALAYNSGSKAFLAALSFPIGKFRTKTLLKSDHNWGYLNLIKIHPKFEYPALAIDASQHHSIVAYLPNEKEIRILAKNDPTEGGKCHGLGFFTIDRWVETLQEEVYWFDQKVPGKKQVYVLYNERGTRGKVVVDMKQEIRDSSDQFCEDVFLSVFPKKMDALKKNYSSMELYRDDWVASQWQLLRDVLEHLRKKYTKTNKAKTVFISGGISLNPALKDTGWLAVPKELAGAQGAGCAMAYLGYCVHEKKLVVDHGLWKDYLFA